MKVEPYSVAEAFPILLAEAVTLAAAGAIQPVTGVDKLRGYTRAPADPAGRRREWRLLGVELVANMTMTSTSTAADALDLHRILAPLNVVAAGYPRNPYLNARGDWVRWLYIERFGRAPSEDPALATSQTGVALRIRTMLPFAGIVGEEWWDAAPRPGALRSVSIGRNDADLPANVSIGAMTVDVYAWVAPCHKTTLPRAFCVESFRAPSDTEARVESGETLHNWGIIDTDDAFTGTDQATQITVGGRLLCETPRRFRDLAANRNRVVCPEGGNSPNLVQIDEGTPEYIPLVCESPLSRKVTAALKIDDGAHANFSADVGGTIYYNTLVSWEIPAGSSLAREYMAAAKIKRSAKPVASRTRAGMRPGVPVRLVA